MRHQVDHLKGMALIVKASSGEILTTFKERGGIRRLPRILEAGIGTEPQPSNSELIYERILGRLLLTVLIPVSGLLLGLIHVIQIPCPQLRHRTVGGVPVGPGQLQGRLSGAAGRVEVRHPG